MEAVHLRKLGIDANITTWNFLQQESLSEDERSQMIQSAYASNYLWEKSGLGTKINQARGHWLISRVMCVAGNVELAASHAALCKRYTEEASDCEDFDRVYAVEAEARVAAMQGNLEKARELRTKAEAMAAALQDAETRDITIGDVKAEPWFGLV